MHRRDLVLWLESDMTQYVLQKIKERYPLNYYKAPSWDQMVRTKGQQDVLEFFDREGIAMLAAEDAPDG